MVHCHVWQPWVPHVGCMRLLELHGLTGAVAFVAAGATGCSTGEDHFLESKKPMCLRPRKWDCCSDLFAKNGAALNTFASATEWQDSGEHGCWLKVSSPACMSPVFAKAPCCLELFGCCCRRLSQHGVGEVLIPLRQCWRDAFSVFAFALLSFVLVSWCVVCFWAPPSSPP